MKQYKVFRHPDGRLEPVKQGWSWPAFFFSWFWALFKRMWVLGLSLTAANAFLGGFLEVLRQLGNDVDAVDALWTVAVIVLHVVFGLKGNTWRETNLQRRGYDYRDVVTAATPDGAAALFLKQRQDIDPERATSPASH